jgi:hypothetical protein
MIFCLAMIAAAQNNTHLTKCIITLINAQKININPLTVKQGDDQIQNLNYVPKLPVDNIAQF